jgi:hypothetical protein
MWTTAKSTTCLQVHRVTRPATIPDFGEKRESRIFLQELPTGTKPESVFVQKRAAGDIVVGACNSFGQYTLAVCHG